MSSTLNGAAAGGNHCTPTNDAPISAVRLVSSGDVNLRACAVEVPPASPERVTITKHGFELLDRRGNVVAWVEHAEMATRRARWTESVDSIRRCRDGEVMATKLRRTSNWQPRPYETPGFTLSLHWGER